MLPLSKELPSDSYTRNLDNGSSNMNTIIVDFLIFFNYNRDMFTHCRNFLTQSYTHSRSARTMSGGLDIHFFPKRMDTEDARGAAEELPMSMISGEEQIDE